MKTIMKMVLMAVLIGMFALMASAGTYFAKPDACGAGDGSDWGNAMALPEALAAASAVAGTGWEDGACTKVVMWSGTAEQPVAYSVSSCLMTAAKYVRIMTRAELDGEAVDPAGTVIAAADAGYRLIKCENAQQSAFWLSGVTVTGFSPADDVDGGAIRLNTGAVLSNCVFRANSAKFAGAVAGVKGDGASRLAVDCVFEGNTSSGGWARDLAYVNCRNCEFRDNVFEDDNGSQSILVASGSMSLEGCKFHGNSIGSAQLIATDRASLTLTDCEFYGNTIASGKFIAAAVGEGHYLLTGCSFHDNTCSSSHLFDFWNHSITTADALDRCTFRDNTVSGSLLTGLLPPLRKCAVIGNTVSGGSSPSLIHSSSGTGATGAFEISDSLIADNRIILTANTDASFLRCQYRDCALRNSTVIGNVVEPFNADESGWFSNSGLVATFSGKTFSAYNSLLTGNYPFLVANGTTVSLYDCLAGNLTWTPKAGGQAVDRSSSVSWKVGDQLVAELADITWFGKDTAHPYGYALKSGAPVVDKANADYETSETDLAGLPRIVGPAPDIGCYECTKFKAKGFVISVFGAPDERTQVDPPRVAAGLVYTGAELTGVAAGAAYEVEGGVATAAGDYTATVTLKDKETTRWTGGGSSDLTLSWSIAKAENAWTAQPSLPPSWAVDEVPHVVAGQPKFGEVSVTWGDGQTGWPSEPGDYTATFAVAGTDDYGGLVKEIGFRVLPAGSTQAALEVSPYFRSNMVLQRGKPTVWGRLTTGKEVTVTLENANGTYVATGVANGKGIWTATFENAVPACGENGTITVTAADETTVTLENVLVGDVYLCIGQSNMAFEIGMQSTAVQSTYQAKEYQTDQIRWFQPANAPADAPEYYEVSTIYDDCGWVPCSNDLSIHRCPATAFFFATELRMAEVGVPIGLTIPAVGGTNIERWMNPAFLAEDEAFSNTVAQADGAFTLYNGAYAPIERADFTGAIWWQGCSDVSDYDDGSLYERELTTLIGQVRATWGETLPFYIVQLHSVAMGTTFDGPAGPESKFNSYVKIREAERLVYEHFLSTVPVGLASAIDIYGTDVHPNPKYTVARRMARQALAEIYGRTFDMVEGPVVSDVTADGGAILVEFDAATVGEGLTTAFIEASEMDKGDVQIVEKGAAPAGFAISADGTTWYWATAEIVDARTVELSNPSCAAPKFVHYAYFNITAGNQSGGYTRKSGAVVANLYGKSSDGLLIPAPAFGTIEAESGDATSIRVPTAVRNLAYTGEEQTGVAAGTGYTVTDGSATAAGDYTATVALVDPSGTHWRDGTTAAKTIPWSIAQAANAWTVEPSLSASVVNFGEALPVLTVGTAKFGEVKVVYDGDESIAEMPAELGNHTVTVSVEGTGDYAALEKVLAYSVIEKPVVEEWGYRTTYTLDAVEYAAFVYTNTAEAYTFTVPAGYTAVDALVVGGGGAGGCRGDAGTGGGGGAGGFLEVGDLSAFSAGATMSVKVGAGGIGGSAEDAKKATSGEDSSLTAGGTTYTAHGGGRGGVESTSANDSDPHSSHGSGGGGGVWSNTAIGKHLTGTDEYGNDGGKGANNIYVGGGGGGAGAKGADADTSKKLGGAGGEGKASSITGSEVWYAGGGGGGSGAGSVNYKTVQMSDGGKGGGGRGGPDNYWNATVAIPPVPMSVMNGTDGLGGGGGGVGTTGSATYPRVSGNGGSGTVIIRVKRTGAAPEPGQVIVPVAAPGLVYTGAELIGVTATSGCTVEGGAATDAGSYTATAKLSDKEGTTWVGGTTDDKTIDWSIAQAENGWTVEPSLSAAEVEFGKPLPELTVGTAKFGEMKVVYDGDESIVEMPASPGNHTVTVSVAGTDNWTALSKDLAYSVVEKPVVENWGYRTAYTLDAVEYAAFVYTNTDETFTFTVPDGYTAVDALVVGGGGAGGCRGDAGTGGGGGAGGFLEVGDLSAFSAGATMSVKVGAGGIGGSVEDARAATSGEDSSLTAGGTTHTAHGGGCGGVDSTSLPASSQGSGGGGGVWSNTAIGKHLTGTDEYGNDGGKGANNIYVGGGGGGAGAKGADAVTSGTKLGGAGGEGKASSITGSEVWYAGGGGGGSAQGSVNYKTVQMSDGGKGGGGRGGPDNYWNATVAVPPVPMSVMNGTDGLGGGGGGVGTTGSATYPRVSGNGGSGTVIIRVKKTGATPPSPEVVRVTIPTAVQGLVFTGEELTGVAATDGCTVEGGTATDAGSYTATAALVDKAGSVWTDGTTADRTIPWSIAEGEHVTVAFDVSKAFGDNMVLQRGTCRVWGKATTGKDVTVALENENGTATVTATANGKGEWTAEFANLPACSTAGTLTIAADGETTKTISDVVVGDVYLCMGQSNMAFNFSSMDDPAIAAEMNSDYTWDDQVRCFTVDRTLSAVREPYEVKCTSGWVTPDAQTGVKQPATPYGFAKALHDAGVDVPIGVVVAAIGATQIELYLNEANLGGNTTVSNFVTHCVANGFRAYHGMIAPLEKLSISGALWWQGGNNGEGSFALNAADYRERLEILVKNAHDCWGADLPFYYMQIPGNYGWVNDPSGLQLPPELTAGQKCTYPEIREGQRLFLDTLAGGTAPYGMATSVDVYGKLAHPPSKLLMGRRLARFALRDIYGQEIGTVAGPALAGAVAKDGKITLTFSSTGKGLLTAIVPESEMPKAVPQIEKTPGTAPQGFAISADGTNWVWADAEIGEDGKTVVLSSASCVNPLYFHYGYSASPACASYNSPTYARAANAKPVNLYCEAEDGMLLPAPAIGTVQAVAE